MMQGSAVNAKPMSPLALAGIFLFTLFASVVLGFAAAVGSMILVAVVAAVFAVVLVVITPIAYVLWMQLILTFIVTGPITYFLHISQVQWIPYLIGFAYFVQIALYVITNSNRRIDFHVPFNISFLFGAYIFTVIFATLVNDPTVLGVITASRYYFMMWGLAFIIVIGLLKIEQAKHIWLALLAFSLLQAPVAAYQYLFVATERQVVSTTYAPSWDAVIGTFSGTDTGGGNSAAMATYLAICILLAIALWHSKFIRLRSVMAVVVAALAAIAMAEVKAVVVMLPLLLAMYYRKELLKRPIEALFSILAAGGLMVVLLYAYQTFHYDSRILPVGAEEANRTMYDRFVDQFDTSAENRIAGQLGRAGQLLLWWEDNVEHGDMFHTLLGHGIGATQVNNFYIGEIARKYGDNCNRSTTVLHLWEIGVLGHGLFIALLLSISKLSARMAKSELVPSIHRVFLRLGGITTLLFVMTLPYKPYIMNTSQIQFIFMLIVGQSLYWYGHVAEKNKYPLK